MRRATLPGLLLLAAAAATAPAWALVELPSHQDGRSVYDFARVVRPEDAAVMERQHAALRNATGVSIVVVTMPDLEGEPVDDFAVRLGQAWGVGKTGEDRGLVVALDTGARRVFVATGYGTEGYLPDGRLGRILDDYVLPYFRRNDFSRGLLEASSALVAASAQEYNVELAQLRAPQPAQRGRGQGGGIGGTILAVLMLLVFAYLAIRHPRLLLLMMMSGMMRGGRGRGGFGGGGFGGSGGGGFGGFGGGGFGGGGAGRSF